MAHKDHHARTNMHKHKDPNPTEYESQIYQKGLKYERPPLTFKCLDWERLAVERMSAESSGYVAGKNNNNETAVMIANSSSE
jgi:lactate 2-monooxygenase